MISVNKEKCIGCMLCAERYPEIFEMKDCKAFIKQDFDETSKNTLEKELITFSTIHILLSEAKLKAKQNCLVGAISIK